MANFSATKYIYRAGNEGVIMSQQTTGPLSVCSSESPATIRNTVRQQLNSDVAEFLSRGGNVSQIADNVRADPPRKPNMNYGSAPI
jgi:hypothetical protein